MNALKLVVVVCTTRPAATSHLWGTWRLHGRAPWRAVVVWGGRELDYWHDKNAAEVTALSGLALPGDVVVASTAWGVVPNYLRGIEQACALGADIIACLHDDLAITEDVWDGVVTDLFLAREQCLLAGFGGARGLGDLDIYKSPYRPQQLARRGFMSNMRDAEAHGERTREEQQVACLDGFSLIGRAAFMERSFRRMWRLGMVHHAYDSLLGVMAAREGGQTWLLPLECHHAGGQTAVGDPRYAEWAQQRGGDGAIWEQAHRLAYEEARGWLPLDVE